MSKRTIIQPAVANDRRRIVTADGAALKTPSLAPSYFASGADKEKLDFFSTGCGLIDEALGGGFVLGRVSNVVGDRSSGKTLLAMESSANFASVYQDGAIRYGEAEEAFDPPYAEALGIPMDRIELNKDGAPLTTVEEWFDDLHRWLDALKGRPGLYIIDSLDALSDAAEMERGFEEGSFGGNKPKQVGKLFRMSVDRLAHERAHLMVISQLRDKLGVSFGETKTRSGGKALDFYATHIMWLAEKAKMKRKIGEVERIVGVEVQAYVKKNKVGLPFRKADYSVLYGYGVDDLMAMAEWLYEVKRDELMKDLGFSKNGYKIRISNIRSKGGQEAQDMRASLRKLVRQEWAKIETEFLPPSRKY